MEHIAHLSKDKKLKKLISGLPPMTLKKSKPIYLELVFSIISQQLSTKVAQVIQGRFLDLFDTRKPGLDEILSVPFEQLRAVGLSNAKTVYVREVCQFFIQHKLEDKALQRLADEELIALLTQIKGVGRWTSEMILMFSMAREDVFAADDLGIQQAMARLYQLDATDKKQFREQMLKISAKWSPYRTYACRYLWAWKDGK
ncbi:MAG TPA: DNA-3-methyladenine glycosylase 2 family protein [Chitinophagaceae bacterium]|nr:DNA-3-methyladenine glycosylase 2 family protein [Chitinophagaceae bacterium]HRF26168.1 DNA-3-methyladenine glycosylase 2 family protein [Ferruginibacter sp.]